jgi:hypothetical protein
VELPVSGGVKQETKTPATERAAAETALRPPELEVRAVEASEYTELGE